ncbi:MAG: Lrp/AsnC family transcriptional regulator [Clostridia bacterium]|nr:Lrp/AsnC family transcriptional regulator [Clostridia bacterium]
MENKERILKLLEEDATLTTSQIAVMLDAEEEEVKSAIKQYEKEGVINGYRALINWDKTPVAKASALIELRVTPQRNTGFDEIAARVMGFPEVESVYLMSGGYDLAVMVSAKTMQEVALFVAKRLAPIEGILSTATHFVLSRYKDGGVVYDTEYEEIDERGSNLID